MTDRPDETWLVWADAVKRIDVDAAIRNIYEQLAEQVAIRKPVCDASGRCCDFEAYDHRLYVTGLEIAWVIEQLKKPSPPDSLGVKDNLGDNEASPAIPLPQFNATGEQLVSRTAPEIVRQLLNGAIEPPVTGPCIFQQSKLCSAHAVRPLGCRIFFCEPGTEDWQQDMYERHLDTLRHLHREESLPYRYMEWRTGLAYAVACLPSDDD